MGTLFWVFTLLGCAVLVAIWLLTLEGEHNRQRKLKKIQQRLEQIERADDAGGAKDDDD
ncbi:MAG: hypothetical protein PVF50_00575 [Gammaproteobacteria bacterium]|jgi:hypothetical protein